MKHVYALQMKDYMEKIIAVIKNAPRLLQKN